MEQCNDRLKHAVEIESRPIGHTENVIIGPADPNLDPSAWDLNGFDEQLRSVHTARMWNHKFVYDWPMRNCFMAPSSGIYKSTIPGRPDDAALNLSLLIAKVNMHL
ncbi:10-methylenetetrahydrofolate reductase,5 [Trichinella spiralis]|uniref:10-methylenetetrahydrofolate reductase,5 n=1 Tax=Trichinella spiralis TaxID=6334 RepID=A0ABR3KVE5_TRISP